MVVVGVLSLLPESAGNTPVEKRMMRMSARMMLIANTTRQMVILMFFQKYLRCTAFDVFLNAADCKQKHQQILYNHVPYVVKI